MVTVIMTHLNDSYSDAAGASQVAQVVKNLLPIMKCRRCWFDLWVSKIPWNKNGSVLPAFLVQKIPWVEELKGHIHWVARSQARLRD